MITFEKNSILATGVGRRKSASALVKILSGTGEITLDETEETFENENEPF